MKCRWRDGRRSSGEGNEVIRPRDGQEADWQRKNTVNKKGADWLGRTNEADSEEVCRWAKEGKPVQKHRRKNTVEKTQNTENNSVRFTKDVKNGLTSTVSSGSDDGDGCYVNVVPRPQSMEMSAMAASTRAIKAERPRSNTSEAKLEAKKRVIRMLVVIVVLFFLCWMPLYCANTWRAFDDHSATRALSGTPIAFIHLLCYTSACVNPIIYCFMNTRFRKALLTTFSCCAAPCQRRRRHRRGLRDNEEDIMAMGTSMSKFSYTTVSTMGTC